MAAGWQPTAAMCLNSVFPQCFRVMKNTQAGDIFSAIVHVPFGGIGIRTSAGVIVEMVTLPRHFGEKDATDAVADKAVKQILRYIDKPDYRFKLPLAEVGSDFQRRVWDAIASIPRGEVRTYGQIAKFIRSAPRGGGAGLRRQLVFAGHTLPSRDGGGRTGWLFTSRRRGWLPTQRQALAVGA